MKNQKNYSRFCLTLFSILFLFCVTATKAPAFRIGTRDQRWITTSTEHFRIIYPESQKSLGLHYAKTAEKNLQDLSQIFTDIPPVITIIINDSTDLSNGYATVLPYPHIMIFPVQIGEESALSEAGEWANELLVHELTHILQLYPARNFYEYLKPVFGSIIAPNLLMPTWWKEGMAVEIETLYSPRGRLRSSYQSAVTRAFQLDNRLSQFTLAQANDSLMKWPYGNLPYYWGSYIFSDLVNERETRGLSVLVQRQAERLPYFIDAPMIELTGGTYDALFKKAQTSLGLLTQEQIGALKSTEITTGSAVDQTLRSSRQPHFTADGLWLALIGTDDKETRLHIFEKTNKEDSKSKWQEIKFTKPINGDLESFVFHPLKSKIYFTKLDQRNQRETFAEVYEADLQTGEQKQITTNRRARQLAISPDASKLAFISSANGITELALLHLPSERVEFIHTEKMQNRINGVTFLNNTEVLFSVRDSTGEQFQYVKNIETQNSHEVQVDSQMRFPLYKDKQLYFVSDKTGVLNIYKATSGKSGFTGFTPVTNVLTGVQSFDVNPKTKTIAYTQITSNGFQVVEAEWPLVPPQLKTIDRFGRTRYPSSLASAPLATVNIKNEDDYSPWSYLVPKYWIPFIGTSSADNGVFIQAITSGMDPLQTHLYQAQLSYDTALARAGYFVQYTNAVWPWAYQLSADQSQQMFGSTTLIVEKRNAALGIIPDVFKWNKNLSLAFGPMYSAHHIDPTLTSVPTTEHAGAFISASYSSVEQKAFHYFPMSGWTGFGHMARLSALQDWGTAHQSFSRFTGAASYFHSDWLPRNHLAFFKANLLFIPESIASRYGTSNTAFPTSADSARPEFMLRGYKSGQFFGTQLATVSAEYRVPILDIFKGSGSDPFFVRHITGAIVTDGLTVKGTGLTEDQVTNVLEFGSSFWSAGAELRLNTTLGYMLPVTFVLGGYAPLNKTYSKSAAIAMSLQIGALN